MDWSAKIFAYCERGLDPGFWAEPANAVSNAAFVIAATLALTRWWPVRGRAGSWIEAGLIALVGVIGVGSFLFHTLATRWAAVADTAPIGVFMLAYLVYALRAFGGLGWRWTAPPVALFVAALWAAGSVRCGAGPCLNGSLGYAPALVALAATGLWLRATAQTRSGSACCRSVRQKNAHAASAALTAGAAVFLVSLAFRTLDRSVCPATALVGSGPIGTHFIWHIANAVLLYLLLAAAVAYRGGAAITPRR